MIMNTMNLKMIKCIACGADMPELRLTKYGYKVCVNCSTTGAYRAVSTVNGSGDHTWNDIHRKSKFKTIKNTKERRLVCQKQNL